MAPQRRKRRVRKGRRRRGDLRPRAASLALRLAACMGMYVVAVNAMVIGLGGGYPHPLSPRFMKQKTLALGALATHAVGHVLHDHTEPPQRLLRHAARQAGVAPELLVAIAQVESAMLPHRVSHAGAMGMMQLTAGTAAQYGVDDPFEPAQAAAGAARYVAWLSRRYGGELDRIAAAYNAGPGRVARRGPLHIPAETRTYVTRVLQATSRLQAAARRFRQEEGLATHSQTHPRAERRAPDATCGPTAPHGARGVARPKQRAQTAACPGPIVPRAMRYPRGRSPSAARS